MATEIDFLLEIILETKSISDVRKKCRERIAFIQKPTIIHPRSAPMMQQPSTIAAMEKHEAPIIMAPPKPVGGLVDNGDGTKGKRKW